MIPRATYRLQFSSAFGFRDAADIAPYLADLGISHVYASPFFEARPGSTHGYDITDHNRLNPELGSDAEFRAMCVTLRRNGLGLIADFVPNHMGIGGASNQFWLSVLELGEESPYAAWFDIDWRSTYPGLAGKVLVPFLGGQYGDVLADGGLELRAEADAGAFAVWAHGTHKLPICPRGTADILRRVPGLASLADRFDGDVAPGEVRWRDARSALADRLAEPGAAADLAVALDAFRGRAGDLASWSALDGLIARQNWRASKFDLDRDAINYRRFFTISDLAGLRVEDDAVFDATHGLLLALLREGLIDGVRIDHIDGLRDPKSYALRLREKAGRPFYLLVEKILARDERLPAGWGADGTTGYEVANLLIGLAINPDATEALTTLYSEFTGRDAGPEAVVRAAKIEVLTGAMAAEVESIVARLHALAQSDPRTRDLGRIGLKAGLVEVIASFDVYRTYADAEGIGPGDRARIMAAVERARAAAPALDPGIFDLVGGVLTGDHEAGGPEVLDCAMRAQQVTGPIMAKGLEDAALYRFNRLIALNEVGSEPGHYCVGMEEFHAANARRRATEPAAMLTTSTHDTKRGEDARTRIAAISWNVDLWRRKVGEWRALLGAGSAGIDPNDEYFFYQMLLGAWPAGWDPAAELERGPLDALRQRVEAAMVKSIREAGVKSRWVFGDEAYEACVLDFVGQALDHGRGAAFLASFRDAAARLAEFGAPLGLVQTVLKLTLPGVPDIYQGAELWEQSLVDPDNRRPVDFGLRARMLAELGRSAVPTDAGALASGATKLALIARLLAFRKAKPTLFAEGDYVPLPTGPDASRRVCAFRRRGVEGELLVAAAIGWRVQDGADWADSGALTGTIGKAGWEDILSATPPAPDATFARLPVAVLFRPATRDDRGAKA